MSESGCPALLATAPGSVRRVPRYELPLTHRPTRDGQQVTSAHVPFYLAMEMMAEAWGRAVNGACDGVLQAGDLGVVHVTSDFGREVFVGEAVIDVTLQHIGTSSLTFQLRLTQADELAVRTTAVVAQVDPSRKYAVPFSIEQRAALELLAKL